MEGYFIGDHTDEEHHENVTGTSPFLDDIFTEDYESYRDLQKAYIL